MLGASASRPRSSEGGIPNTSKRMVITLLLMRCFEVGRAVPSRSCGSRVKGIRTAERGNSCAANAASCCEERHAGWPLMAFTALL